MQCKALIEKLETLSPRSFAEAWDNVGLLAGSYEKEIHTVMIALDATDEVVEEMSVADDAGFKLDRFFSAGRYD